MDKRVPKIAKIDSSLSEREIITKCRDLFQQLRGPQARHDLQWLRKHVPVGHPLRYKGELAFWNMYHSISETEFKKRLKKRGHFPLYAWELSA